jgi:hypothetical protein
MKNNTILLERKKIVDNYYESKGIERYNDQYKPKIYKEYLKTQPKDIRNLTKSVFITRTDMKNIRILFADNKNYFKWID